MEKDLISILVPVYNSEKYLRKCLNSLKNQTYENIEIICVNDGSTDSSYEVLLEYQNLDNRFKVFTQENSGPAKTRNHCLSKAQGEYIMFCDSDDTYEPNMCQRMIETIKKENVNLVMCLANLEQEKNVSRVFSASWCENLTTIGKVDVENLLSNTPSVLLWHKIFKKSLIDKYKLTFPDVLAHEDCLFCYAYFCICKTAFGIKDKLYNYLLREDSVMDKYYKRKTDSFYDSIKLMKNFYSFLVENNLENKYKNIFYHLFMKKFFQIWSITKNAEERQEQLKFSKELIKNIEYRRKKDDFLYMIENYPYEKFIKMINKSNRHTLIYGSQSLIETIKYFVHCYKIYKKTHSI